MTKRKTVPVYAVFQEGVYRHECAGIFKTEEAAINAAVAVCRLQDDYHTFSVIPFVLDEPTALYPLKPEDRWGQGINEKKYIAKISKDYIGTITVTKPSSEPGKELVAYYNAST